MVETRFGWEHTAERFEAAYRRALANKRCRAIRFRGSPMTSPAARKPGLSVFFPAYNDSGTIASLVISALRTARTLTPDFEVIVVNDGSADATARDPRRAGPHLPAGPRRPPPDRIAATAARCAAASRRRPATWCSTPTATRSTIPPR